MKAFRDSGFTRASRVQVIEGILDSRACRTLA